MSKPSIFVSYSHRDTLWKDRLLNHLGVLKRHGDLDFWVDDQIGAGEEWKEKIQEAMRTASAAIILVSANFLNSPFIHQVEIAQIRRRKQGGLRIVPIIITACAWKTIDWLAAMEVRPQNGQPLAAFNDHGIDESLTSIVLEINDILSTLQSNTTKSSRQLSPLDLSIATTEVVPETIVFVDIVESTRLSDRYGWNAVGKPLLHGLRELIEKIRPQYGLACRRFTGDGYLLTFSNTDDADKSVVQALRAIADIASSIKKRNAEVAKHYQMNVRFSMHFGQVEIVDNDREGLDVAFAFRLEEINAGFLSSAFDPMSSEDFPLNNYVVMSEKTQEILLEQQVQCSWEPVGILRLRGFTGLARLFLVRNLSDINITLSEQ